MTNKTLYACLTLYMHHVLDHVHPGLIFNMKVNLNYVVAVREALSHRLIFLSGDSNRFVGPDLVTEFQNRFDRFV